jgi:hypothetical protein
MKTLGDDIADSHELVNKKSTKSRMDNSKPFQ